MAHRDVVVIGASAGGIETLQQLLRDLPPDLDAAVLVALHTSRHAGGVVPQILARAGNLPACYPRDRETIRKGHVYVAPPDFHLILEGPRMRVVRGPRENLHRPAIDPLFRSAARWCGNRAIAVVLTGLLDDGTAGSMVIRRHGGRVIVEDPERAMFRSMPASALRQVPDADVLPVGEMGAKLVQMIGEELPDEAAGEPDRENVLEIKSAEADMSEMDEERHPGKPSVFACPDCGGVLWELEEEGFLRFRCRVGHAYTMRNLDAEQHRAIETALWSALRALEESASLYRRMAQRAEDAQHDVTEKKFRERVEDITENARVLRDFLISFNDAYERESVIGED